MGGTRSATLNAASSYHLPFSICQGAKRHCAGRGHGPECPDKEMKAEAELMEKVRGNLLFCQAVAVFWTPGCRDDMHLVMERCDCDLYTVVIPQDPPDPRRRQLYEDEGQILIRWGEGMEGSCGFCVTHDIFSPAPAGCWKGCRISMRTISTFTAT